MNSPNPPKKGGEGLDPNERTMKLKVKFAGNSWVARVGRVGRVGVSIGTTGTAYGSRIKTAFGGGGGNKGAIRRVGVKLRGLH